MENQNLIIKLQNELNKLSNTQSRLVRLCNYLENDNSVDYDDLISKLMNVIGTIEDVLESNI